MADQVPALTEPPEGYAEWLADLKGRVHSAQQRALPRSHRAGPPLLAHRPRHPQASDRSMGGEAKVIDRLAHDLREAFPDMKGFSPRNLKYMRAFAQAWPDEPFVQEVLARLPWYHQLALLERLSTTDERRAYAHAALEHGWSRNVLVRQIEARTIKRQGKAITNFADTLPAAQTDLAREALLRPWVQSARQVRPYAFGEPWRTRSGDLLCQLAGRHWRVLLADRRTGERLDDAPTAICEQRAEELI